MKKVLLSLVALFTLSLSQAQTVKLGEQIVLPKAKGYSQTMVEQQKGTSLTGARHAAPRKEIKAGQDQLWWGYWQGTEKLMGLGVSQKDHYDAAIFIPGSDAVSAGKSIKALRFALGGVSYMKDLKVWLSTSLPATGAFGNLVVKDVDLKDVKANENFDIALDNAIAIAPAGLYMGLSFDMTDGGSGAPSEANYPLLTVYDGSDVPGAMIIRTTNTLPDWTDMGQQQQGLGKLAMQVLLEGEFEHNAVSAANFLDLFAVVGGSVEAEITLTNNGLDEVKSISYVLSDGENADEEKEMKTYGFSGIGAQTTIYVPVNASQVPGKTERTVLITKVNGQPNTIADGSNLARGTMVTLSQKSPKRTVVEEFTGTWCGWCPRGIVGLEMLKKSNPDAITIAVHKDDPMQASDYNAVTASGYPSASVNRMGFVDPYYGSSGAGFGLNEVVNYADAIAAEASVSLTPTEIAKDGKLTLSTDVTFRFSSETSNYSLAYVIVADSLTGEGSDWMQHSYYAGDTDYAADPNLKPWVESPEYVSMSYNHVPIVAKGISTGLSGSVKAPIVDGEVKNHKYTISLSGNSLAQHLHKLSAVALLINTKTGFIVNADIKPLTVAEDFPKNSATLAAFDDQVVVKGDVAQVPVLVTNLGLNGVHSFDYLIRTNGKDEEQVRHIELEKPMQSYGMRQLVNFPMPADSVTGYVNKAIILKALNGTDNESSTGKTSSGKLMTIAKKSPKKTVVEEYTGTWCGWCPRGMVGLELISERYPDTAIPYAMHYNDPMQCTVFNSLTNGRSFPTGVVNRYITADPYYGTDSTPFGIGKVVDAENELLSEATIQLNTPYLDEETGTVTASTDITFQLTRHSCKYSVGYVLVADGLTGTSSDWSQTNYYYAFAGQYADDPNIDAITKMDASISGLEYNHVAIAANGISSGLSGSIKSKVNEGEVISHETSFTLSKAVNTAGKNLVQDKKKLKVIALLFDNNKGRIINADVKAVVDKATGISSQSTVLSAEEVARYSADGKRISAPVRGLNIIRMSDGSVRKVVIK